MSMDKVAIQFFADVLYANELITLDELEGIYDVKTLDDLDRILEVIRSNRGV